jgi:hypothetical protein
MSTGVGGVRSIVGTTALHKVEAEKRSGECECEVCHVHVTRSWDVIKKSRVRNEAGHCLVRREKVRVGCCREGKHEV